MDKKQVAGVVVTGAILIAVVIALVKGGGGSPPPKRTATPTVGSSATFVPATPTATPSAIPDTSTPTPSDTPGPSPTPTATSVVGNLTPYPSALSCLNHDVNEFHTLWNPEFGCHYSHEHGQDPYMAAVAAAFPGFDLQALNCGFEIGHCNPSSPTENIQKHGGMKFQVAVAAPQGCAVGFEGGTVAADAYAIQYHAFGRPDIELEARIHSAAFLVRQCQPGNPSDKGYIYVVQHVDYGQRTIPYQGMVAPYPNTPNPAYPSGLGPYWSSDCVGPVVQCRSSLDQIRNMRLNANAVVTSKSGFRVGAQEVISLLWRSRDAYQVFDWNDQVHPFTYPWICSTDGGLTYNPTMSGCRWNNSTTTIHEIQLQIPIAWDNLPDFDTDPRFGRITATGFLDFFGDLNPVCSEPEANCFPIKMVGAFVGFTSSEVSVNKVSNPNPVDTPERDIYFCDGLVCSETSPGAVSSGWLLENN